MAKTTLHTITRVLAIMIFGSFIFSIVFNNPGFFIVIGMTSGGVIFALYSYQSAKQSFEQKIHYSFEHGEWEAVHNLFATQLKTNTPDAKVVAERWRYMFKETERNYSLGMAKLRSRLHIILQALEVSDYAKTQQELEFAQQEMELFKIYSVKSNFVSFAVKPFYQFLPRAILV